MELIARIPLGGEAGNTQFDSVGGRIYVAVQTNNEMAAIAPKTMKVVARYPLPGSEEPHAHTVAVDPETHRVFLPLKNVDGKPVLRIMKPGE